MPLSIYKENQTLPPSPEIKNIIAVAAGKGGVGKSTVAVNLALALQKQGFKVGLLDADLYGPSIRKMLPEETPPEQKGEMLIPAIAKGIKTISMAYFKNEAEAAIVRAPIANGLVQQFVKQTAWGRLDYLIIDFPPGTGDIQLSLCQKTQLAGAVIVTTPQEIALLDVRKTLQMFQQLHVPIIGVIENMSYFKQFPDSEPQYLFGRGGGSALAQEYGLPFLGKLPIDPDISSLCDKGLSLFDFDVESLKESTKTYLSIASQIRKIITDGLSFKEASSLAITKFEQISAFEFQIIWSDGKIINYRLNKLQSLCPCAGCEEARKASPDFAAKIATDIKAHEITQIGRYAIKISFASGCSNGIYSYELLRNYQ